MAAPSTSAGDGPPTATTPPTDRACPHCGGALAPLQEYCLECGLRVEEEPGVGVSVAAAWGRRGPWYAGDWILPVLAASVVAVLATAAAVAAARSTGDDSERLMVATLPEPASVPLTDTAIAVPTETTPAATTAPRPAAPPRRRVTPGRLTAWPANKNGWTVVLASVPKADGLPVATGRARAAAAAGLSPVGVVDSDEYASLHPGYYVVFTGIFETQAEAERGRVRAASAGYDKAYPRPVTR